MSTINNKLKTIFYLNKYNINEKITFKIRILTYLKFCRKIKIPLSTVKRDSLP